MSRDIKRDIMSLVTCLPPEDILVLTLYIGSFQYAIDRKDTLLRELVDVVYEAMEGKRYCTTPLSVNCNCVNCRVVKTLEQAKQEVGDE